ncbi:MAG: hypothetical protein DMG06_01490 [Acidobacteria bacterium]|nr:MAG: hypothetical protein DMG06_01490 [Acidobacteriota bacterium]
MYGAEDPGSLHRGRLHYFPVVPGKLEFAEEVRRTILLERPQVVAVELPSTLESAYLRAVGRLPELSVILYEEAKQDRSIYIPVEITDPFVEGIRSAQEIGAEVFFVDPDIGERPHLKDFYPDSYAVRRLGYGKYVEAYRIYPQPSSFNLKRHAAGIAWKLQSLDPLAEVLVVISLNLLDPVLEAMQRPQAEPLAPVHRQGVQVLNLHPDCLAEVLIEFPLLQSVYEVRRYGSLQETEPPHVLAAEPLRLTGPFRVISSQPEDPQGAQEATIHRVARHVGWLKAEASNAHSPLANEGMRGVPPAPDSLGEGAELAISTPPERFHFMDRQRLSFHLFAEAERRYEKNTREKLAHWQRRLFARYTRNLALVAKHLVSGLFDLTVAARSIVDDNFAWELWELAASTPFQKTSSDLMTVNISGEELWLNMKRILLRRRLPREKALPRPLGLKGRKKEKFPGEWARQLDGNSICSYPPEDIVLENYGLFLKKKGKSVLSEERSRVEPFTTSLLDGIDLRETLRNWHEGKLYVREFQKISGEVGAVVVIFEEDRENHYPWSMTWLGEHSQESDMAFYSTNPYDQPVGPGITRAEYGGFLLSYPPRRMLDVWHDPDYWFAESKPETLLLAALDYTLEKFVVYVAAHPPRSIFKTVAARLGRKIIYIPIGQLSPISLKKIRVVHVLDSHERRAIAKDYLW